MKSKLLAIVLFALSLPAWGQEYSSTKTGMAKIHLVWNGNPVEVHTENLNVILNYENAEIKVRLDLSTVRFTNAEVDSLLARYPVRVVEFTGKLGIEFIQTQKHPEQDFEVEGRLNIGNKKPINGNGHLKHLYTGTRYACHLNAKFQLSLAALGFEGLPPTLDDAVQVEIIQIVMKRSNE
jgi:hypothetical protein